MHPANCPNWEYEDHPNASILAARCAKLLVFLRSGRTNVDVSIHDTRPFHLDLFLGLTPATCDYYAGHYRGEAFRCLEFYEVEIRTDSRVGVPADRVISDLSNLSRHIVRSGFAALNLAFQLPDARVPPGDKLYYLVTFACRVLEEFLRIHPYANGNGHIARFIIWMILARFGYWPQRWPLDESPPYHDLLRRYRDGDRIPLEMFVLKSVLG